jgi:hypothetical protein
MGKWINKIYSAIRTLQQPMINIRAAIAAFGFVIFGWGREAGGHEGILSVNTSGKKLRCQYSKGHFGVQYPKPSQNHVTLPKAIGTM